MAHFHFIFVRHGQSRANADSVIANPQSPLTIQGIEQARHTAQQLLHSGITRIVCSPFDRARQTAEIIAKELNVADIQVVDELHERYYRALNDLPKDHDSLWYFGEIAAANVETPDALLTRMQTCLERLEDLAKDQVLLVVSHAVAGFYLLQVAAGKTSLDRFASPAQLDNAAVVEVEVVSS